MNWQEDDDGDDDEALGQGTLQRGVRKNRGQP